MIRTRSILHVGDAEALRIKVVWQQQTSALRRRLEEGQVLVQVPPPVRFTPFLPHAGVRIRLHSLQRLGTSRYTRRT